MEHPASDFDGAWKAALTQYFAPFLALFFPVAHAAIDWNQPVVSRDPDLQQIAPEDRKGKQRVDTLMQVTRTDGTPTLVLIHIEIQSQRDPAFPERMFLYHARIFDRERVPVVSLAILGDEDASWRPDHFGSDLWGCRLHLAFPMVKLRDLDPAQLEATVNPLATLTLVQRDAQETRGQPQERLRRKVMRYRALLRQGYAAADVRALLRLIEQVLRLSKELAAESRSQMRQVEVEELGMETFVTSFEELAREEERRDLVLQLLTWKLGALTPEMRDRVAALSPDALLDLSKALLDFAVLADLTAWLAQQEQASDR
jgi:hypothetical protein